MIFHSLIKTQMEITPEQITQALFVISEVLALVPDSIIKSNGFMHTIVCLVKTCHSSFDQIKSE